MRACAVLLLAAVAAAEPRTYGDVLQEGLAHLEDGEYEKARAVFDALIAEAPDLWYAYFWHVAGTLEETWRSRDARRRHELLDAAQRQTERMTKACGLFFTDPLVLYLEGMIANLRQEWPRAADRFEKALRAPPAKYASYDDIRLRARVEHGLARALVETAKNHILHGRWEPADRVLAHARRLVPAEDAVLAADFHRHLAIVDENLGRFDDAVENLYRAVDLNTRDPAAQLEMLGAIALIHLRTERLDKAKDVLDDLPPETSHPEIVAARCMVLAVEAKREPESPKMDEALAAHRKAMEGYPEDEVYRLVVPYGELVLEKVRPAEAEKHRSLLEEVLALCERERKLRPECAILYWIPFKIHQLLGQEAEARRFQALHEEKTDAAGDAARFDHRGRPRC